MIAAFRKATARALDRAGMLAAFSDLDASPYLFRLRIDEMLPNPDVKPKAALARVRGRLYAALGFDDQWSTLNALQRAVAVLLAEGAERPFSEASVSALASRIGDQTLTTGRVQTALKNCRKKGWPPRIRDDGGSTTPSSSNSRLRKGPPGDVRDP